ncbi:MAG: hypothetical protein CMJ48_01705, partial [Planctomycetaceae bacterium]|nr:hypothetical protein [Planctomycetaceae bacterium]
DRVISGYDSLRQLTAPPLELSREEALERLQGTLVGPDRKTSCAVVVLTFAGNAQRTESIEAILNTAEQVCELPREELYVAGPPVDGVAIDTASKRGINLFGMLSTIVTVLLCRYFVRSWMLTGAIIMAGLTAQGFVLALVPALGRDLDAILIVMPSLVLVLTVSAGIHLVNYYRARLSDDGPDGAASAALRDGWKPCLLAAGTTAIGLLSLTSSQIAPVVVFGIVASSGVMFGVTLLLLLLPGAMEFWPLAAVPDAACDRELCWDRLAGRLSAAPTLIALCCIAFMVAAGAGLSRTRTSVDIASLFPENGEVLANYRRLEQNVGPVVPVEIVLSFDSEDDTGFRQQVELVSDVHRHVAGIEGLGGVVSAATFAPVFSDETGFQAAVQTRLQFQRLFDNRQRLINEHYLFEEEGRRDWRISARVSGLAGHDYAALLARLETEVEPLLVEEGVQRAGVHAEFTGIMPLIHTVQQTILEDLLRSFLSAFALVAIVMMLVLRSVRAGLLAMVPNLFPIVVVFGGMAWLGVPIDIGSVMTASVALGIAVDDTLHLIVWYRRAMSEGRCRVSAVEQTLRHSGRAMLQTTLICGLGLLVFAFADFVPTQRFGLLMAALLAAALLGDLILLPALLACPLGRWFIPRGRIVPAAAGRDHSIEVGDPNRVAQIPPSDVSREASVHTKNVS